MSWARHRVTQVALKGSSSLVSLWQWEQSHTKFTTWSCEGSPTLHSGISQRKTEKQLATTEIRGFKNRSKILYYEICEPAVSLNSPAAASLKNNTKFQVQNQWQTINRPSDHRTYDMFYVSIWSNTFILLEQNHWQSRQPKNGRKPEPSYLDIL